jgi:hypothetical protein
LRFAMVSESRRDRRRLPPAGVAGRGAVGAEVVAVT